MSVSSGFDGPPQICWMLIRVLKQQAIMCVLQVDIRSEDTDSGFLQDGLSQMREPSGSHSSSESTVATLQSLHHNFCRDMIKFGGMDNHSADCLELSQYFGYLESNLLSIVESNGLTSSLQAEW